MSVDTDARVVLRLRHPSADGTTHLRFEPTAFLERLAAGAAPTGQPGAVLRRGGAARGVAGRGGAASPEWCDASGQSDAGVAASSPAGRRRADLVRWAFEADVLACRGAGADSGCWRCSRRGGDLPVRGSEKRPSIDDRPPLVSTID
jgi:hypothetical protein